MPPYQAALSNSGYTHTLTYNPNPQQNASRRNRSRNITWYNPPFCTNSRTNIGRKFLHLIDYCFPASHPLRKIINRNTVKISYSCLPNIGQIIQSHNNRILSQEQNVQQPTRTCNCRGRQCPLSGNCLVKSVVYQAVVTRQDNHTTQSYVGITKNTFKSRFDQHSQAFTNPSLRLSTELSKHIHMLKNNRIGYSIKWSIIRKCSPYSNATKKCQLCLYEKYVILCRPELCSLNKRSELTEACMHARNYKLKFYKNT